MAGKCSAKARRRRVDLFGAERLLEPAQGFGEDGGVDVVAVVGDHGVAELVDEAHGEEGSAVDRRVFFFAAQGVQSRGEPAGFGYVGEDDVAGVAEEDFV